MPIQLSSKNIKISDNVLYIKTSLVNQNGIIAFKQNWCGYCKENEKIFKELEKKIDFPIYEIEGTKNPSLFTKLSSLEWIKGYPTIFLIKNGVIRKSYKYSGERSVSNYIKLIKKVK